MIKKRMNMISVATSLIFGMVILFTPPGVVYAADEGSGSSDSVRSEIEPLPYIIVGALVIFVGLIVFDIIFRPYEEKKDDGKEPIHSKVPKPKETTSQTKPKYSTDYDYMLGMTAAQASQQFPAQINKARPKQ